MHNCTLRSTNSSISTKANNFIANFPGESVRRGISRSKELQWAEQTSALADMSGKKIPFTDKFPGDGNWEEIRERINLLIWEPEKSYTERPLQ